MFRTAATGKIFIAAVLSDLRISVAGREISFEPAGPRGFFDVLFLALGMECGEKDRTDDGQCPKRGTVEGDALRSLETATGLRAFGQRG